MLKNPKFRTRGGPVCWVGEALASLSKGRLKSPLPRLSEALQKPLNLEPGEDLLNLFGELGKGRRGKGDEEEEKSNSSHQLSFPIQGCLII